ncbi:MnhB domain-containing protein [Limisphaera sp. VF-2]|jgi:multicomponent Na+:H+ antiporter subunit B|uniref:MnhB domain-containing protein n=1 Tax=Limisphaera sp. VF-2 TaxID=3400418 RepID=UPI001751F405
MTDVRSYIFDRLVRGVFYLLNLVAFYLLWRGHNLPGGGFIAGLASAISLILLSLALGVEAMPRILRMDPMRLAAAGLGLATGTGLGAMVAGRPFLEHFHLHVHGLPWFGEVHLGTPFLFDVGVYLIVVGVVSKMLFVFMQSTRGLRALVEEEERRYSSPLEQPLEESARAANREDDRHAP